MFLVIFGCYGILNTSGEDGIQTLLVIKGDFSYDGIKSGDSEPQELQNQIDTILLPLVIQER